MFPTLKSLLSEGTQQLEDTDAVREKLADLGSAADIWMGQPQLEKLLTHLNAGGKVKCFSVDTSRGEDKHDRNGIFDQRVKSWQAKGWELFDYEWDGDNESVDVVMIKK